MRKIKNFQEWLAMTESRHITSFVSRPTQQMQTVINEYFESSYFSTRMRSVENLLGITDQDESIKILEDIFDLKYIKTIDIEEYGEEYDDEEYHDEDYEKYVNTQKTGKVVYFGEKSIDILFFNDALLRDGEHEYDEEGVSNFNDEDRIFVNKADEHLFELLLIISPHNKNSNFEVDTDGEYTEQQNKHRSEYIFYPELANDPKVKAKLNDLEWIKANIKPEKFHLLPVTDEMKKKLKSRITKHKFDL